MKSVIPTKLIKLPSKVSVVQSKGDVEPRWQAVRRRLVKFYFQKSHTKRQSKVHVMPF